jgi:tetratricopeptide (TPR) repeat protein
MPSWYGQPPPRPSPQRSRRPQQAAAQPVIDKQFAAKALADAAAGAYDKAFERIDRVARSASPTSPERAHCDRVAALVHEHRGSIQRAVELMISAIQRFATIRDVDWAQTCRLKLAALLVASGNGSFDRALGEIDAAASGDALHLARCDQLRGTVHLLWGHAFAANGDDERAHSAYLRAVGYMEDAQTTFSSAGASFEVARCEEGVATARAGLGDIQRAIDGYAHARASYVEHGRWIDIARVDHNVSTCHGNNDATALEFSGRAVAAASAHSFVLANSEHRHVWATQHGVIYGRALRLAEATGDQVLLAELIESARLNGVRPTGASPLPFGIPLVAPFGLDVTTNASRPAHTKPSAGRSEPAVIKPSAHRSEPADAKPPAHRSEPADAKPPARKSQRTDAMVSAGRSAIGLQPLSPSPTVAVFGPSRLGAIDVGIERPHEIQLARIIRSVAEGAVREERPRAAWRPPRLIPRPGGPPTPPRPHPTAWWWGTWTIGDRVWWNVISPDSGVTAGSLDLSESSQVAQGLGRLQEAAAVLADPSQERILATLLGQGLLPKELRRELLARRSDEPAVLTVAPSPDLAHVPFGLLALDDPDPKSDAGETTGDTTRVLERAIVTVGASAWLLDVLLDRAAPKPAKAWPIEVAVVDPRGDLYGSSAPVGARVVLGKGGKRASRAALSTELRRVGPSVPASVAYIGHAKGTSSVPADAELLLGDDEVLTARELVDQRPDADQNPFPFPDRVLLAACATAGKEDVRNGQWMGLAPAVLWSGARTVVATSWDLRHHPATNELDHALAKLLYESRSPAVTLRLLQREQLARWRDAERHPPGEPKMSTAPLIWAPYIVLTISKSPDPLVRRWLGDLRRIVRPQRRASRRIRELTEGAKPGSGRALPPTQERRSRRQIFVAAVVVAVVALLLNIAGSDDSTAKRTGGGARPKPSGQSQVPVQLTRPTESYVPVQRVPELVRPVEIPPPVPPRPLPRFEPVTTLPPPGG